MKQPWRILPEQFIERLQTIVPSDLYEQTLAAFSMERKTSFRINTLKMTKEQIEALCKEAHIAITPVIGFPNAYILSDTPLRTFTEQPWYQDGHVYVQSLSSMIPPIVLDPHPEEHVLDLCAAPGSKTTQMAAMMHNAGSIMACDNSRIRIYKLEANLTMQGVTNTTVQFASGQAIWEQYPEYFDKVLVDVPCSMEGRITTTDSKSYDHWSRAKIKELARRQKWLLRSAISATKPGGTIVYATCTLAPEENEAIIDWILKKEQGNVILEPIVFSGLSYRPGLSAWKEKTFHPDMAHVMRIFPSKEMEGFFVAKLKKRAFTVPQSITKRVHFEQAE